MANILVTGGNRGIGQQICKQFIERGDTVYATTRSPSPELAAVGAQVIDNIDVTNPANIESLRSALSGVILDILLNNAGVLTRETYADMDFERIQKQFEVNTIGPLRVVHDLDQNLSEGSKVGIITSRVGSMEDNGSGGIYGYRISKAAANMVGKNLSHDLGARNIPVVLLHPGLVATEMTGGNGIEPTAAAQGIIERLDQLTMDTTGTFWHAEGYQLPW